MGATVKGIRFNGCYFFRDGDRAQIGAVYKSRCSDGSDALWNGDGLQRSTVYKGALANGLNAVIQRKRCEICAACKGSISHRLYRTLDGKSIQVGEIKGLPADGSDALWNGDVRQIGASLKGIIADRRNIFT